MNRMKENIKYLILHRMLWIEYKNMQVERIMLSGIRSSLDSAVLLALQKAKHLALLSNKSEKDIFAVHIKDADFAVRVLLPWEGDTDKDKEIEHTFIVYDNREEEYDGTELFRKYVVTGADWDEVPSLNPPEPIKVADKSIDEDSQDYMPDKDPG